LAEILLAQKSYARNDSLFLLLSEILRLDHNDVFVWDEENQLPIVQNPLNCVVGCESCAQLCPSEAITFPSKEELRTTLRRLREEKKNTGETAQPVSSGSGQPEMAGEP
jgi:NAD-dependent dihydropyrimidine dehydrogenase PreA subunit